MKPHKCCNIRRWNSAGNKGHRWVLAPFWKKTPRVTCAAARKAKLIRRSDPFTPVASLEAWDPKNLGRGRCWRDFVERKGELTCVLLSFLEPGLWFWPAA